jgi:hypothetical protein
MAEPLHFYDHHRQRYAGKVPIPEAGEFMIGEDHAGRTARRPALVAVSAS